LDGAGLVDQANLGANSHIPDGSNNILHAWKNNPGGSAGGQDGQYSYRAIWLEVTVASQQWATRHAPLFASNFSRNVLSAMT
jgi:hypothetical protein